VNEFAVLAAIAALVMLFVLAEIASAVLPIIIVVALVPPEDRDALAKVIAACDSSHKLRIWPALRAAVKARRCGCGANPGNLNSPRGLHNNVETQRVRVDQPQSPAGSQR
jgi:hypothetical protein